MFTYKNLMTVGCVTALALGLAACGSSSDDDTAMDDTTIMEPVAPESTEAEVAATAAGEAATAAKTAADNAATAAMAAMAAVANLATMQTGEMAGWQAAKAHDYAAAAMQAYTDAMEASETAAAATTTTAAVEARVAAEAAQADAEAAAMKASEYSEMAVASVASELMIDGTMKSVGGDTTVDATAPNSVVTTGTGAAAETVITGLISEPVTGGAAVAARAFVADDPDTPASEAMAYRQAVAARTDIKVGKVVDSSDDAARLMIFTKYVGTKSVRVYAEDDTGGLNDLTGTVNTDGSIETGDGPVTLKPVSGTYYLATPDATDATPNELDSTDVVTVTSKTKDKAVFTYEAADDNDAATDETRYVVLASTTVAGATTTVEYQHVDITATAAPDDDDLDQDDEQVGVKASVPDGTDYSHVHFGVWAGLSAAAKDGSQKIADLGIGFVQSIGDGLTSVDMPNNGTASYSGNWAAAIQGEDPNGDGDISLESGAATVTANFTKDEITASLTGLASLEGDISGNTFEGTKATPTHGDLNTGGKFTGSFSGGFYGDGAAETAGIFDFATKDNKGGAFRGAFGGDRKDDE